MKTPHELSEDQMTLSEEYSRYAGEFARLNKERADYYNLHRVEYKSDTACERAWESTTQGVLMVGLKLKLKALEKQMSAIRTHLRLLENEAKNLY